jgi:hypothetical protein
LRRRHGQSAKQQVANLRNAFGGFATSEFRFNRNSGAELGGRVF